MVFESYLFKRAAKHTSFRMGFCGVLLLLLFALLSFFWTPWPVDDIDIPNKLAPPSAAHWFGTDSLGHDVASMLLVGCRNSLLVGCIAVGIGLTTGACLGLWAAAAKGWTETLVIRLADASFAFPALLLAIMLTSIYGPGLGISVVAIGIFNIPVFVRITRAEANAIWTRDYIAAARAAGMTPWGITWDHVIPNIRSVWIVQATNQFAIAILAEAALSYIGLGTQPPNPSWGRMLNDAQSQLFQAPLLAIYPGVAIALSVMGLNLMGDGLRDLLDPKLSRGR